MLKYAILSLFAGVIGFESTIEVRIVRVDLPRVILFKKASETIRDDLKWSIKLSYVLWPSFHIEYSQIRAISN